ncbi:MAG: hypothetical protein IPP11_10875 [Chitinophagaceae bacterium]|nr:hypothetical protein [Chitinophagaceae bacterium]
MFKKEDLNLSLLESKISIILKILKFVFLLSVIMNCVSLVFVIFSTTKYYYHFENPSFLDVLQGITVYAAFYIIIFAAFPSVLILTIIYFLFKFKLNRGIQAKKHFRLIILNILILFAIFLVVVFDKS